MKILVLAAHPDDETLGCGGSISAFLEQGNEVFIAVFSPCYISIPEKYTKDILKNEFDNAMKNYGIEKENTFFYGFPVRRFSENRQDILEEMVKIKRKIKPDIVFTHSSDDIHQDHHVINKETIRCFKGKTILGYELPWNSNEFKPKLYIPLKEKFLNKKIDSLLEYKTQVEIKRNYFSEDFIKSLAKIRGIQGNSEFAEAFEIFRMNFDISWE